MIPRARIPVARPRLPTGEQIAPYLAEIDRNQIYANYGPLYRRLLARLEQGCGLPPHSGIIVTSGTTALTSTLLAVARPGPRHCLMPSWTFVATAAAAVRAGLTPWFVDVDADTWALDPQALAAHPQLAQAAAVVPVAPFGRDLPYEEWAAFTDATGVPVVVDAAAGFDSVATRLRSVRAFPPTVVSLHATKPLSTGEGGLVLCQNTELLLAILQDSNFGYDTNQQIGTTTGANFKLSEFNAAVGLAGLDLWAHARAELAQRQGHYATRLREIGIVCCPQAGAAVSTTYCAALPVAAGPVAARLAAAGIETRTWWKSGVHRLPAYVDFPRDPLPVTTRIAERVIGLPFFIDMTLDQIDEVVQALAEAIAAEPRR